LSRISGVFVIGRNSSIKYDGDQDPAKVGRELGCRYLVQGSARKADNRVRINARVVEADSGVSKWGERYDRRLDDIFDVQDAIAMSLIGALEPKLRKVEIERVRRKRPDNLDAYDLVLRALPFMYSMMPAGADEAVPLLQKALELERDYSAAQAHLARYKGQQIGTFGVAATYSFYPGKNLGAMGDAGAVVTNDDAVAEHMTMLARHHNEGAIRIQNVDPANDKIIRTFSDLVALLEAELGDDGTRGSWVAGSTVTGSVQPSKSPSAETGMEMPEGDSASLTHCQLTVVGCWLSSGPGKVSSMACALGVPEIWTRVKVVDCPICETSFGWLPK
jgi:hypothetical protein